MKRLLLVLLLIPILAHAQWDNAGTTSLQRQTTPKGYFFRDNYGSKNYVYWYTKGQIDSIAINLIPLGLKGQILKIATDNTSKVTAVEPLVYGQFIYTDAQLTAALNNGNAVQLDIFNSFKRYAHGGTKSNGATQQVNDSIPSVPLQTNSWSYDTVAHAIKSTFNSGPEIGFYSNESFINYVHTATLTSTGSDNDRIGIVLAFYEDTTDMVVNAAYGQNPASFNWPINTTSQFIPNQHSLTLFRGRETPLTRSYFVVYDYWKTTQKIIAQGSTLSGLQTPITGWLGNSVDVKAVRLKDTITVYTSQFSDATGGKGALGFPLRIDLNSDPLLYKFKGSSPYGYAAQSQNAASFSNIYFSGSNNVIYDLRNGNTYPFGASGYVLDPTRNMYRDLGLRFFWRNKTTHAFGYIPPTGGYDVIVP